MRTTHCVSIITLQILLAASAAIAQPAPQSQRLGGIVLSSTGASFVIVDNNGNEITLTTKPDTAYTSNRVAVPAADVIKPGMEVRCSMVSPAVVGEVQARGQAQGLNPNQL